MHFWPTVATSTRASRTCAQTLPNPHLHRSISTDGLHTLAGCESGSVHIWDLRHALRACGTPAPAHTGIAPPGLPAAPPLLPHTSAAPQPHSLASPMPSPQLQPAVHATPCSPQLQGAEPPFVAGGQRQHQQHQQHHELLAGPDGLLPPWHPPVDWPRSTNSAAAAGARGDGSEGAIISVVAVAPVSLLCRQCAGEGAAPTGGVAELSECDRRVDLAVGFEDGAMCVVMGV